MRIQTHIGRIIVFMRKATRFLCLLMSIFMLNSELLTAVAVEIPDEDKNMIVVDESAGAEEAVDDKMSENIELVESETEETKNEEDDEELESTEEAEAEASEDAVVEEILDINLEGNSNEQEELEESDIKPNDPSDFRWNGTVITSYLGTRKNVVIPEGTTGIAHGSFSRKSIESIVIPSSVSSIDGSAFYCCEDLTTVKILSTDFRRTYSTAAVFEGCNNLTNIELAEGLKVIPTGVFKDIPIESINIPTTVEVLDDSAFYRCSALKSIDLSNTKISEVADRAFYDCKSLIDVKLPETYSRIGSYAFENTKISSIDFPDEIVEIGWEAFYGTEIEQIVVPANVKKIGSRAFASCDNLVKVEFLGMDFDAAGAMFGDSDQLKEIVIPEGTTRIPNYFYSGCNNFEEIVVPETVTSIGGSAFSCCNNLKKVVLPDSVEVLGDYAFKECSSLDELDLSNTKITEIPGYAFAYCGIANFKFPNNVKVIGWQAFLGWKLPNIEIPDSVVEIKYNAFGSSSIENAKFNGPVEIMGDNIFSDCNKIKRVEFAEGQKKLGKSCFATSSIEEVVLPGSVEMIDQKAFYCCKALSSVDLSGTNIKSIGDYAFDNCAKLVDVRLPAGVETIGSWAFSGTIISELDLSETDIEYINFGAFCSCSQLKQISLPNTLCAVDDNAFASNYQLTDIYVSPNTYSFGEDIIYLSDGDKPITRFHVMKNSVAHKALVKAGYSKYLKVENSQTVDGCTVVLNPCGGNVSVNQIYLKQGQQYKDSVISQEDETVVGLPSAAKSGYEFLGWYTCPQNESSQMAEMVTDESFAPKYSKRTKLYAWYSAKPMKVESPAIYQPTDNKVSLINVTPGANIYYCIDVISEGLKELSIPTAQSIKYEGMITITEDCVISAIAEKDGVFSEVVSETVLAPVETVLPQVTFDKKRISLVDSRISVVDEKRYAEAKYYGEEIPVLEYAANYRPYASIKYTDVNGVEYLLSEKVDFTYSFSKKFDKTFKLNLATVTLTGKGKFTGKLVYKYYIVPKELSNLNINILQDAIYTGKKGLYKPEAFEIIDEDANGNKVVLKNNVDYTIKFLTQDDEKVSSNYRYEEGSGFNIVITGKGYYEGTASQTYYVNDYYYTFAAYADITASNVAAKTSAGLNKPKVVVKNNRTGKKMTSGREYQSKMYYFYGQETVVTQKSGSKIVYKTRAAGEEVNSKDIIPAGTYMVVAIVGKGRYFYYDDDSCIGYATFMVGYDMSKASVSVKQQQFDGTPSTPDKADITVKIGGKVVDASNFEILYYEKNTKPGTATVYLMGYNDGFGIKKATFKINKPKKK